MTEEQADHSRWAWDTAPTDGSPPGPVYIGDMEDWSHEETVRRRDTNWDPWGGVWDQPLRKGATKAKWGKTTFDSGRYRCCKDSRECGVQVAVKQGPIMAWHFQRQWTFGKNKKYEDNCKNESDYKGPTRFHNIVVNEIYRHLHRKQRFLNQAIKTLQKEKDLTVRQHSGDLSVFRPDIFVKLANDSWYTIEVILTHPPERDVHEACNQNLIEIDLNELHCLDSDREFNKWVQDGGVQEILGLESSLAQRKRRWNDRNKRFKVDDEKAFRRSIEGHISKCRIKFGFRLDIDIQSITNIEQVTRAFEQEEAQREQAREAREAREKFDNEISEAVERNIEKYGERISRATNTYSSPDEVDRIYNEHFTKKAQDEKRKADMEKRHAEIQAEVARCEELYGFTIDPLNFLNNGWHLDFANLAGPEAVEPYFEKKKARIKAGEKALQAVKAKANEWRQVGYPQAIAQLEKEFGLTEEEVGCDSDFSLEEIREGFEWLAAHNKQERRKAEENTAKQAEKEKLRNKAKSTKGDFPSTVSESNWWGGSPEDEIQFRKVMKEIQQKHGRHITLDSYPGWTEKELWIYFDAQAEEEKAREEEEKAREEEEKAREEEEKAEAERVWGKNKALRIMENRIQAKKEEALSQKEMRIQAKIEKDALALETKNALEAIETISGKDRVRYWKHKNDLEQGANNEIFSAKAREMLQADLDKLIETEGQKWGDPAAS
jgi:hypothetical protein